MAILLGNNMLTPEEKIGAFFEICGPKLTLAQKMTFTQGAQLVAYAFICAPESASFLFEHMLEDENPFEKAYKEQIKLIVEILARPQESMESVLDEVVTRT